MGRVRDRVLSIHHAALEVAGESGSGSTEPDVPDAKWRAVTSKADAGPQSGDGLVACGTSGAMAIGQPRAGRCPTAGIKPARMLHDRCRRPGW